MTSATVALVVMTLWILIAAWLLWALSRPAKHECSGAEVGRVYTPPSDRAFKGTGYYVDLMKDMIYGFTIITYECECGNVWTKKVTGQVVSTPERHDD